MSILTKTLKDAGFDGIFTEVVHTETLGLKNPNQLRMFHLAAPEAAFSFSDLHRFLLKNIGRYVFSRVKIDQFYLDGEEEAIGAKARDLLKSAPNFDANWIDDQLGDLLMYVFLEQVLEAPKLFSKVELLDSGNETAQNGGGVHLRSPSDDIPSYQMVFGKSHVVGDIQDAIDNAFVSIEAAKANMSGEMHLVENAILTQSFPKETADHLKEILIPSKQKADPMERAFGVFLGYSLGLDASKYSNADFRKAMAQRMNLDIKAHTVYIANKISAAKLGMHSFYFYILPFNDAIAEKQGIMKVLLEGGT